MKTIHMLAFLGLFAIASLTNPPSTLLGGPRVSSQAQAETSRPVIMVHGFISTYQTWNAYLGSDGFLAADGISGFAVGDGQVPGVLNTGSISDPGLKTNTIAENAAELARYVQGVRERTGANQVDLLAHSMGGLISRYYIDRLMERGTVAELIMLGSPMLGTSCANLPASLDLYLPATLEIRPSYIRDIFNLDITDRKGVAFYALAGTALTDPISTPCTPAPSDIAVSLESVGGIALELTEMPILHTVMTNSPDVYQEYVRPLLLRSSDPIDTGGEDRIVPTSAEAIQFTRVYTGHVAPGTFMDITIPIESGVGVASFAMFDTTRTLSVTVTGASGNTIALSEEKNGLSIVKDPQTLFYLGYGFNDPKPGIWKVTVSASSETPALGADFALSAQMIGGVRLAASANPLLPELSDPVILTANLEASGQAIQIETAQALVRTPAGERASIPLVPSADGSFSASYEPLEEGLYSIDIVVSGMAPDGTVVQRTAFLSVQAQPQVTSTQQYITTGLIIGGVLLFLVGLAAGALIIVRRTIRRLSQPPRVN